VVEVVETMVAAMEPRAAQVAAAPASLVAPLTKLKLEKVFRAKGIPEVLVAILRVIMLQVVEEVEPPTQDIPANRVIIKVKQDVAVLARPVTSQEQQFGMQVAAQAPALIVLLL
jgi:hypothetical protein